MSFQASKRVQILLNHLHGAQSVAASMGSSVVAKTDSEVGVGVEFFELNDLLKPNEIKIRQTVRQWVDENLAPIVAKHTETAAFPEFALSSWAKLGLGGGTIKGNGCAGMTLTEVCLACMELARVSASFATFYMVHDSISMASIGFCGSDEQKAKYLPQMARAEWIGSFALTEPDVGSDASHLHLTAKCIRDPQTHQILRWTLNGRKRWIGNATMAEVNVIWATDVDTKKVLGFIVRRGAAGFRAQKIENKLGLRIVQNADLFLDNVMVDEADRLPAATNFQTGPARVLQASRVIAAWLPVGIVHGVYEKALAYTLQRKQFGKPLAAFQLSQEKLFRIAATLQAMTLMAWRVTRMYEQGKCSHAHASTAKAFNTLRGRECVSLARELLGGNGLVYEFGVAAAWADLEAIHTYEGTYEINALIAARALTGGLRAFN